MSNAAYDLLADCADTDLTVLPDGTGAYMIALIIDRDFSSLADARSAVGYHQGELRRALREARRETAARSLPIARPARRTGNGWTT